MKKFKSFLTLLAIFSFLLFFTENQNANATTPDGGCSWGYSEVTTSPWWWNNTQNSKYCDCDATGGFESGIKCKATS